MINEVSIFSEDQSHFRIQKTLDALIINHKNSQIDNSLCITKEGEHRIIKKFGKYIGCLVTIKKDYIKRN